MADGRAFSARALQPPQHAVQKTKKKPTVKNLVYKRHPTPNSMAVKQGYILDTVMTLQFYHCHLKIQI